MIEGMEGVINPAIPTKESVAYTRYADNLSDEKSKHLFVFPRGQPYRRINNAELFKIQKPENHWEVVSRQKAFLKDKFCPPFDVKDGNLKVLLGQHKKGEPVKEEWKAKMVEEIRQMN